MNALSQWITLTANDAGQCFTARAWKREADQNGHGLDNQSRAQSREEEKSCLRGSNRDDKVGEDGGIDGGEGEEWDDDGTARKVSAALSLIEGAFNSLVREDSEEQDGSGLTASDAEGGSPSASSSVCPALFFESDVWVLIEILIRRCENSPGSCDPFLVDSCTALGAILSRWPLIASSASTSTSSPSSTSTSTPPPSPSTSSTYSTSSSSSSQPQRYLSEALVALRVAQVYLSKHPSPPAVRYPSPSVKRCALTAHTDLFEMGSVFVDDLLLQLSQRSSPSSSSPPRSP